MRNFKDILIQDIGEREIKRFLENSVYRRPESPREHQPIYFAPHFTCEYECHPKGISYITEILGIIQGDVDRKELSNFTDDTNLIEKWIQGLEDGAKAFTYYFLGKKLRFSIPLQKVPSEESKGWIGKKIPSNRQVSFVDFISHLSVSAIIKE